MPDERSPDLRFSAESRAHEAQGTRYPDLAELLPQIVYEMDVHGDLTFANRHAFKLLGYTREDFERGLNVVDLLSDAIFLIDNEIGQIVEVNSAASALYGYSREELLASAVI